MLKKVPPKGALEPPLTKLNLLSLRFGGNHERMGMVSIYLEDAASHRWLWGISSHFVFNHFCINYAAVISVGTFEE